MAISMLKIRRPLGRLIFNMGIAIPGKTVFVIETAPWYPIQGFCHHTTGGKLHVSEFTQAYLLHEELVPWKTILVLVSAAVIVVKF